MRKWLVKERKKVSEVSEDFIRSVEVGAFLHSEALGDALQVTGSCPRGCAEASRRGPVEGYRVLLGSGPQL